MKYRIYIVLYMLFVFQFYLYSQHIENTALKENHIPEDSLSREMLEQKLQESKLNEMNLKMEVEQIKFSSLSADSIKRAKQTAKIDSLRKKTPGIPVVVQNDTLFRIFTNRGGLSAIERARQTSEAIISLGKGLLTRPDSIYLYEGESTTDIMYGKKVIVSITDNDGLWMGMSRQELADKDRILIIKQLKKMQEEYGLARKIKQASLFILVIILQIALIILTNYAYRSLKNRVLINKNSIKPVYLRSYRLFDREKIIMIFSKAFNLLRYLLIVVQLFISVPILFGIFPNTRNLTYKIFDYIVAPLKKIGYSFIKFIPDLFAIVIIFIIFKYLVKIIRYFAKEIEKGNLKIKGFYPDWALTTFNIVRFILYALMIVLMFPYLPFANSTAFQGISVFFGILISLGASSAVGNIIAGMILTYMRPFKVGDRVEINKTIGDVIEKTAFVTRIRTLKNEVITIPNSSIMSTLSTNLSSSAKSFGLIIHIEMTLGYDTSWKTIHDLLIDAANHSVYIEKHPEPFVLQLEFNDFNITYQINAYLANEKNLINAYTDLYEKIQDRFSKAGVEIMSPHYFNLSHNNKEEKDKE